MTRSAATTTINTSNFTTREPTRSICPAGNSPSGRHVHVSAQRGHGPNGYVVVGKNIANLFANYTNLNSGNTYGNYSGKLSHDGELVVLAQPESYFGTNTIYVEEDEVTYGTGGRWGEWSGGGGSSLELIDPHSNHRLAANWADSDETQKSVLGGH
jgi:hypothetical protein